MLFGAGSPAVEGHTGIAAVSRVARARSGVQRTWDPFAFIELCERVRRRPGSVEEQRALEVQRAEWQLLFDYCAAKKSGNGAS
jgi:hypothetical protein